MSRRVVVALGLAGALALPARGQPPSSVLARELLGAESSEHRLSLLQDAWRNYRDRGESARLLEGLGQVLQSNPAMPLVLYYRGLLRRHLKLLRGARQDLEAAMLLDPGAPPLLSELAQVAALEFRHQEAAQLFHRAGAAEAATFQERLEASQREAWPRQALTLVLGGGMLAMASLLLARRVRTGER